MEAGKTVPLDRGKTKTEQHDTRFFTEAEQHTFCYTSREYVMGFDAQEVKEKLCFVIESSV